MEARKAARKHVLLNALKYGKAEPGRILGKILGECPELKKDIQGLKETIKEVVDEVNALPKERIEEELKKNAPEMLEERKEEKKSLPELKNTERNIMMRFEPSPSGSLHIGHSYVLSLNAEYCSKYNGKLILRIADTNPANIDPDAYSMIPEDAEWLSEDSISQVIIQSDNIESYYNHALEMIDRGHAYVCTCSAEDFRGFSKRKEECPCRKNTPERNAELWKLMFTKFMEGEAVLRFKTDMKHKNPAMRDFPLARISEEEHPRQGRKYRVWPLMNFSVACDDYDGAITHVLRAKDHADNARRQEYIQHAMGWFVPQTQFVGRINFLGLNLSSSETRQLIEKGRYSGWDDIRLPFLKALRRRGYQPGAFRRYAVEVGVTLADKKVAMEEFFKALNAYNKELIDPHAERHFFVEQPVEAVIEGAPEQSVELDLHPDSRKGGRGFMTGEKFFISKQDLESAKEGELVRLMDCLNFRKKGDKLVFDSLEYENYKIEGKRIIHWLPAGKKDDLFEVEVVMPDSSRRTGLGEEAMRKLKTGDIVQLERFGFCRLDREEGNRLVFWYGHR